MASSQQVRDYLAHWFQLGKGVILPQQALPVLPRPVIWGNRYSESFEECWQQIEAINGQNCYLQGTDQTIADLLSPRWDLLPCSRCGLLVPLAISRVTPLACPCIDLPSWPNTELPCPHLPVDNGNHLQHIRTRLSLNTSEDREESWESSEEESTNFGSSRAGLWLMERQSPPLDDEEAHGSRNHGP